jgi:hypothetical protein
VCDEKSESLDVEGFGVVVFGGVFDDSCGHGEGFDS